MKSFLQITRTGFVSLPAITIVQHNPNAAVWTVWLDDSVDLQKSYRKLEDPFVPALITWLSEQQQLGRVIETVAGRYFVLDKIVSIQTDVSGAEYPQLIVNSRGGGSYSHIASQNEPYLRPYDELVKAIVGSE